MTSALQDYSGNEEAEEQQHTDSSSVEMSHKGDAPSMQYGMVSPVAGQATAQAAYPYPDPYYRSIFAPYDAPTYPVQPYRAEPMVHLQLMGIQQAGVPLPSDTVEEPVFVNAKQYHGILRRRQSRAKAESENKMLKARKPYLHESRHLHALKRVRGCGGRFLNSKKQRNDDNEETEQGTKMASGNKSDYNINPDPDKNRSAYADTELNPYKS